MSSLLLSILPTVLRPILCAGLLCLPPAWPHVLLDVASPVAAERAEFGARLADWGQGALDYTFSGVVSVGDPTPAPCSRRA